MAALRRATRAILRARWLSPLHHASRALLAVSQSPGALIGVSGRRAVRWDCREPEDIVVLSANLRHDWPLHRKMTQRLETFARIVEAEGANVVLLQEVSRTADMWVDRWLADRLGMHYLYSRVNGHRPSIGFEEGLAVFSCLPLRSGRTRRLSAPGSLAHRLALGAELESRRGPLWVFSVHLSLRRGRNARQVEDLEHWVRQVAGPSTAVVGGDFNAHETSPQMIHARRSWMDVFRSLHPYADGTTHALRWPWGSPLRRLRLDYLFLRPGEPRWQAVESRHLDGSPDPHSDHRVVLARLRPAPVA